MSDKRKVDYRSDSEEYYDAYDTLENPVKSSKLEYKEKPLDPERELFIDDIDSRDFSVRREEYLTKDKVGTTTSAQIEPRRLTREVVPPRQLTGQEKIRTNTEEVHKILMNIKAETKRMMDIVIENMSKIYHKDHGGLLDYGILKSDVSQVNSNLQESILRLREIISQTTKVVDFLVSLQNIIEGELNKTTLNKYTLADRLRVIVENQLRDAGMTRDDLDPTIVDVVFPPGSGSGAASGRGGQTKRRQQRKNKTRKKNNQKGKR